MVINLSPDRRRRVYFLNCVKTAILIIIIWKRLSCMVQINNIDQLDYRAIDLKNGMSVKKMS